MTPVIEAIEGGISTGLPLYTYESGSWGPGEAEQLIEQEGDIWRTSSSE